MKRARGPLETDSRFGSQSPKLCVLVYPDSALHKADVDPDEEGSDDEWWTKAKQKGIWGVIKLFSKDASFSFGQFVSWRTGLST